MGKRLNSDMLLKEGRRIDLETTGDVGGQNEQMEGSNQRWENRKVTPWRTERRRGGWGRKAKDDIFW